MTYFDQIGDAVYDGSIKIPSVSITRGLKEMDLSFPLMMVAAKPSCQQKKIASGFHRQKYLWHLHEGLIYILWQESDASSGGYAAQDWLCGEPQFCEKSSQFIRCLQNAIVSFRRQEIKAVIRHQPLTLSFAGELDMRRLALSRIQESKSTYEATAWQSALEVWLEIVLLRHQQHLHTLHRKMDEFLSLLCCDVDGNNELSNTFNHLRDELHEIYSLSELRTKFPAMIGELLQVFPLAMNWGKQDLSPISHQALEWIDQHFSSPVSLAQCADSIPVSAAYLCRILRKETGLSPVQHLQIKRIAYAKVLIQKSGLNIGEIAHRSGFGSTEHFYRVFRKHTNLTPAAYRRNARK